MAWDPTADGALGEAPERFRFGALGWKVMAELPNIVNFEAATAHVRPDDLASSIPHGPDPQPFLDGLTRFRDAGFTHVAVAPVGRDIEAFLRFWADELAPALP